VNSLLAPTAADSSSSDLANTPCLLIFFTHHRPHLAEADMAFFPALAESGNGWAYEKVVDEFAGAMFENDPGDATVRGTVKGWRAWRVKDGETKGEITSS
jgi:nicotinamide N-methyltransferase